MQGYMCFQVFFSFNSSVIMMWIALLLVGSAWAQNEDSKCPFVSGPFEPPKAPPNEYYELCPKLCPTENCSALWTKIKCPPEPRCCPPPAFRCKPGYFRKNGRCVPGKECTQPTCGANEVYVDCLSCPPTNCDIAYTEYRCEPRICTPGCQCKKNYLRNDRGVCVPNDDCRPPQPICGANEEYVDCLSCPPTNCDIAYTEYLCAEPRKCTPGCQCKKNYLRRDDGVCVLNNDCPPPKPTCGANETMVSCAFKCPLVFCPSNDDLTPIACKPPPNCPPGCVCSLGYRYRSETDLTCVLAEDCPPVKCTRPNEFFNRCPIGCWTDSCEDAEQRDANGICNELVHNCQPRCYCKDRYYRNADGICVRKSKCHKCGPNQRYAQCKMACPYDYCPTDDSRDVIACDPPVDCKPGCICNVNYKLRSYTNQTCILASTCPPVKCTRPNEVWSDCPSACLLESCRDARRPQITCNTLVLNCQPRCICKENHFRNDKDICVPLNKCPLTLTEIPSEKIIPPPPGPAESEE